MARWGVDQVLELAPDDSARKAAKGLTSPEQVVRDREHGCAGVGQMPGEWQGAVPGIH